MDAYHSQNYNHPVPIMQNLQVAQPLNLHSSGYGWWDQAAMGGGYDWSNMGIYYYSPHYYWLHEMENDPHWFWRVTGEQMVMMAYDLHGSRFLRRKIREGRPEEIDMIITCVKYHLHELMKYRYSNYLIQKIFEAHSVRVEQIDDIFRLFIIDEEKKMKDVCMDKLGSSFVQKMLQNLRTQNQKSVIISAMKRITVELTKNISGGHVIQDCVKLSSPGDKMIILDEVAENSVDIATNKYGSLVIRRFLADAEEEAADKLIPAIISNAAVLAEDLYGNYVVKFLIKMEKMGASAIEQIIEALRGKYVELSLGKFASSVVQAVIQFSIPQDAATIVEEIMISSEFFNVVLHPFGNYVAQTALQYTEGPLQERLSDVILSNHTNLCGYAHGRIMLECAQRCRVHV